MEATTPETSANTPTNGDFTAAYTSFKTLTSAADRMKEQGGPPSRIDRSYLSNLPGGAQTIFQSSLKSLGLIDENLKPTPILEAFVDASESERKKIVGDLLREHYTGPLALGGRATQAQLEEEFRKLGVSGSTMRKAVGFYLNAARFAGIPVSPNFKLPKMQPGSGRKRTPKGSRQDTENNADQSGEEEPDDPALADLKRTYIEALVKKVGTEEGAQDKDLLTRVEWLLGFRQEPPQESRRDGGERPGPNRRSNSPQQSAGE